ncbi:hypothetical protein CLOM_g19393 [Closterium sp. NIES-68]|nr:hypothetical protein CLOM_g19393 [Closterium sp. NIES-68]GJP76893.1 hypothetical protein CLOP_g7340 [Closterium sp. NIES-67]
MHTDVYRDGAKVSTVARVDYYDFASQQMLQVQPPQELLPGDELRTKCVWDSTSRSEVTMGGESSLDEMCISFLIYYPEYRDKREMRSCVDMCGDISSGSLVMNPASPNLVSFAICGPGSDRERVKLGFSKCNISYGENQPLSVLHGCMDATALSLAHIPLRDISVPISSTPDPLPPSTASNATAAIPTPSSSDPTGTGTGSAAGGGTTSSGSGGGGSSSSTGGKGAATRHTSHAALLAAVAAVALAMLP